MDRVELLDHVELRLHTDDPVLAALVREYWAIDQDGKWSFAVKSLADRYGLAASEVTATVRRVSEARARHVSCPTCGEGVVVRGRADYLQVHRSRAVECRACVQARWKQDQAARQFKADQQRTAILEDYALRDDDPIVVEDLTLQQAVTLLALFRGENQTLDRSPPLSEQLEPLAPTPMVELDWVRGLYEARLLGVHPESPIDAFVWEDDRPARFYLRAVSYYPAGRGPLAARSQALIRELVTVLREGPWPESWRGEWQGVWRELAVAECLAYLALILTDHNMPFTVDDRAMLLFEDLLTSYSIGQAYCFVWRAVKDAVAWHVRRGVPYERVGSATVTFIERALGQARAGSWSVRTYRRDRRLPQSLLSHTFYVTAMHVTDELAVRLAEVGPPKAAVRPTPTPPPEPEPADAAQVTYLSPQPRRVETVPRNAPCPCGSGKKFKRCHGRHNPGQEP